MSKKKINVLGVPYTFSVVKKMPIDEDYVGLCDSRSKEIHIKEGLDEYNHKNTIKHECIHAFLSEAGMDLESSNEYLVNFLATQFEQIRKLFKKLGVINE